MLASNLCVVYQQCDIDASYYTGMKNEGSHISSKECVVDVYEKSTHAYIHEYIHTHAYMYKVCTYIHVHTHMNECQYTTQISMFMFVCMSTHACIHV
jgi:hypothetical protein